MVPDDEEEFLQQLLKYHGPAAIMNYAKVHFENCSPKEVEALLIKVMAAPALNLEPVDETIEGFPYFIGYTLPAIIDNSNNTFQFIQDEKEEERLFGIAPNMEYFVDLDEKLRRKLYYQSLERYDVLVGQIVECKNLEDEYLVRLICFQCKQRIIDDLSIYMYVKKLADPDLKIGDFVRGIFHDCNLLRRKMFLNFDYTHLQCMMKLGAITEEDFPMHYKMMRNAPVISMELFMREPMPERNANLMKAFNINPNKIYSYRNLVQDTEFSAEECLEELRAKRKVQLCEFWLHRARAHYEAENVPKSLSAFNKALKFDSDHIGALLDRAAVYGNMLCFSLAVDDLEHVFELDPENKKAIDYYYDVLVAQADELEKGNDFCNAVQCYKKILRMPAHENDVSICERLILAAFHYYYNWPIEYDEVPEVQPEFEISDDDSLQELLAKKEQLERQMQRSDSSKSGSGSEDKSDGEAETSKEDDGLDSSHIEECQNPVVPSTDKSPKKSSHKHHHRHRKHSGSKKHKKRHHPSASMLSTSRVSRDRRSNSPSGSRGRKSRSLSGGSKGKKSRSPSRNRRSRSISPFRRERKSRSRSRGPRERKARSRSRGPWDRSRSRGPRERKSRSRSRGPRERKSRSRSRGPRERRSRSISRGPRKERSGSRSPLRYNRRSRSISPLFRSRLPRMYSRASRERRSHSRDRRSPSHDRISHSSSSPEVIGRSRPRFHYRPALTLLEKMVKSKEGSRK